MRELARNDDGKLIVSQSMIKAFKMCPREFYYKQIVGIQPKVASTPLTRGKWIHAMLEAYYKEKAGYSTPTVAEVYKHWCSRFSHLFDEERDSLGDLPTEIKHLWQAYMWHYQKDASWKVHEVECTIESTLPNGMTFKGRVDMIVEDEFGLWIVDHKTHKKMPDWTYRLLDEQSPLYIGAAREMGIPVQGFIWNYLMTKGPSIPRVTVDGKRFYKKLGETTYPVLVKAIRDAHKASGAFDEGDYIRGLRRALRNEQGRPSAFFRRERIEKSGEMIDRVIQTTMKTAEAIENYDWSDPDLVERNVNACKGFMCSYRDLSQVDLLNGGVDDLTIRQRYVHEDPWSYYEEEEVDKE